MKKLAIALLAAGALATSFTPAAHAAAPSDEDVECGFITGSDNTPEAGDDAQTGTLYGGPINQAGTLTCTIKVNQKLHGVSSVHGASRSATSATAPTVLPAGVVSYTSPPDEPVYLCDQFYDGSITWVLDARTDTWVNKALNPDAECYLAISAGTDDEVFQPIWDLIDAAVLAVDNALCPVLASQAGTYPTPAGTIVINSQGDVYIDGEPHWDCPPYDVIWP